jgi:hypothetical protein
MAGAVVYYLLIPGQFMRADILVEVFEKFLPCGYIHGTVHGANILFRGVRREE